MTYQYKAQRYHGNGDPFAVQCLPKPFYHPSPTKEVNDTEVIHSPERKVDRHFLEESFLNRGGRTYKTSAVPNIRTVSRFCTRSGFNKMPAEDPLVESSDQFDETWPDSERPSCASPSRNTSYLTSGTEDMAGVEISTNIKDIVNRLQGSKGAQDSQSVLMETDRTTAENNQTGDSVLQRYIERFRSSAPKSREERLKERERLKKDFWWLHSSPTMPEHSQRESGGNIRPSPYIAEPRGEPRRGTKLTKEALLAMDEETMQLQSKADKLLSRSEMSLVSSGPIVSTDGLGTNTSVSDYSVAEEILHPPYRPAFVRVQEEYQKPALKPMMRREKANYEYSMSNKSPADDILSRWRLRRKMEEAHLDPSNKITPRAPSQKLSQNAEMDSRLEEFRKKLLSQRALVTSEDIQYERQKMAMLLEEDKSEGGKLRSEEPTSKQPSNNEHPTTSDPILRRLHKITGSGDYVKPSPPPLNPCPSGANETNNYNLNNANTSAQREFESFENPFTNLVLNRNNTESSDQHSVENVNGNSVAQDEVLVDSFSSQVVCGDPKSKVFVLKQDGSKPCVSNEGADTTEPDKTVSDKEKQTQHSGLASEGNESDANNYSSKARKKMKNNEQEFLVRQIEDKENKNSRLAHETNQSSRDVVDSDRDNKNRIGKVSQQQKPKKDKAKIRTQDVQNYSDGKYHQFLEAEKPIIESDDSERSPVKVKVHGRKVRSGSDHLSFSEEELKTKPNISNKRRGKTNEVNDSNSNEFKLKRGESHNRRKNKSNVKEPRELEERESTESETLTDVSLVSDERSLQRDGKQPANTNIKQSELAFQREHNSQSDLVDNRPKSQADSPILRPSRHQEFVSARASPGQGKQPVQAVIGQTIRDHIFDGSTLVSSVDSWASMFPQSPAPSRSIHDTHLSTPSPSPSREERPPFESTPLQSTPVDKHGADIQAVHDEEFNSDGEFEEDALLLLLRQQRNLYLDNLRQIEEKLQSIGS